MIYPGVENTSCVFWGELCLEKEFFGHLRFLLSNQIHSSFQKMDFGFNSYLVIDSSRKHFLAEGDNVNPIPKIIVLVHPHLS